MKPTFLIVSSIALSLLLVSITDMKAAGSDANPTWTYDPQAPDAPCPSVPSCTTWVDFRKIHPFPYQTFAINENGTEAVVVLSEPPPVFSREKLAQVVSVLFGEDLLQYTYDRWPTGLDGWLEDVVLRVRIRNDKRTRVSSGNPSTFWEAPADIVERLQVIYRLFYRTSDGFWVEQIHESSRFSAPIVEITIPISDIAGWLADDTNPWMSVAEQKNSRTSRQLFIEKEPGVFRREPGLVAFVAPKGAALPSLAADFRRFAVESDLIIGAAGLKGGGLLLLGRSRQIPLDVLPPLRFETFASFARNRAEHVAQSYERQRIFAGKVQSGKYAGWDWAPILLSSQLDDSEFGTLLNLADQLLKSWSQHGNVEYYAFAYPHPSIYPFGSLAASEYFNGKYQTTSLLFNWNTEGFATITTVSARNILTGDRTGALPILYRPSYSDGSEHVSELATEAMLEEADARARDARNYFAISGNPLLVRVVQNVLLYQAEQSFFTTSEPQDQPKQSRSDLVTAVLQKLVSIWLSQIADGKTQEDRALNTRLERFKSQSGFSSEKTARMLASPQSIESELQRAIQAYRTSVSEVKVMPRYLDEGARNADELFNSTCRRVGGHITKEPDGDICRWPARMGETEQSVFAAYEAYANGVKEMLADYKARVSKLDGQERELKSLLVTYAGATQLARILSGYTESVNLDDVLQNVLKATATMPVRGSIRTPSVVLSKNTLDVDSIGGHNIDLVPARRLVVPNIGDAKPVPLTIDRARPENVALGLRRNGSLLDEFRNAARKSDLNSSAWTEVRLKAQACQCDAVVVQGEEGVVYFARNTPPPIQQTIFGKSGVIDALAGPPPVKVVRFENFSDGSVESISRSTALATASAGDSAFDGSLESMARWLRSSERGGGGVSVTIERVGKEPEVLRLSEESGPMALKEPVSWRQASVVEATPEEWNELYGAGGRLDPSASNAVIVRFGGPPGTSPGSLGVRVLVELPRRPGFAARLLAVVERWRSVQPIKPRPWAESIVDLREAIRKQLNPLDLEFYYKRNKGKVRAADASSSRRCVTRWCRG